MTWLSRCVPSGYGAVAGFVLLLSGSALGQPPGAMVDLKVMKYGELANLVSQNKGKVVLVDFWTLGCIPCRQAFPHVVSLHEKLGGKGLVVISVNLDPPERKEKVLEFLQKQKAGFHNILLDEPGEVWQKKFHFNAVPSVFIFNRQGQWRRLDNESAHEALHITEANVDQLVEAFLKAS